MATALERRSADSPTPGDAHDAYGEWFKSIPHGLHGHFEPLTKAFQNWMPSILAYFDHPLTNAYTESLNNLIRVMNRRVWDWLTCLSPISKRILRVDGRHQHTSRKTMAWTCQRWHG
ncbi:transposase [Trinickia sp. LjRoot230]|uniref:transposase n=1 Tax=Trinickia sp. LjRoot230 TaxID=3342288 RepID=UPI003ECCAC39